MGWAGRWCFRRKAHGSSSFWAEQKGAGRGRGDHCSPQGECIGGPEGERTFWKLKRLLKEKGAECLKRGWGGVGCLGRLGHGKDVGLIPRSRENVAENFEAREWRGQISRDCLRRLGWEIRGGWRRASVA